MRSVLPIHQRVLRGVSAVILVCVVWFAVTPRAEGALLVNLGYSYLRLLEAGKVVHHDLHIALEPQQYVARFTDDVTVRATKNTNALYMALGVDYHIDQVTTTTGQTLAHRRHISLGSLPFVIYRIDLDRSVAKDELVTLRFNYHISPDTAQYTFPYLSDRLFYTTISMFWYPQMPTEGFFTATVHLDEAPQYMTMVAEGAPMEGTSGRTWTTVKEVPGFGLAIGEFVSQQQKVAGRDVYAWHPPYHPAHAALMGTRAAQAIAFLEEQLGPLPLDRIDVVALPYGIGGSTGQYSWFIYDEMNEEIPLDNEVMLTYMAAHEAAHKWIGFTAGTQLLGTTWITEGLTDYLAFLTVEGIYGTEALHEVIKARAITPLSEHTGRMRAVSAIEITDSDVGIALQKGSLIFRTLHRRLGDDAFFALLRTFISEYTQGHATSRNFTDLIEREGGEATRRFVADWVNGTHVLDYAVEGVQIAGDGAGERLSFKVVSKGRLVESGPIQVVIYLADGLDEWLEVELGQEVTVAFDQPVEEIVIDPDFWTPDWNRENNVWQG